MQWTWTWTNSRRCWGTGRPGMLQSMGSQRVRHDWATEQPRDKKLNLDTSVLSSFLSVNHWHKCFLDPRILLNTCLSSLDPQSPKDGNEGIRKVWLHKDKSKRKEQQLFWQQQAEVPALAEWWKPTKSLHGGSGETQRRVTDSLESTLNPADTGGLSELCRTSSRGQRSTAS